MYTYIYVFIYIYLYIYICVHCRGSAHNTAHTLIPPHYTHTHTHIITQNQKKRKENKTRLVDAVDGYWVCVSIGTSETRDDW